MLFARFLALFSYNFPPLLFAVVDLKHLLFYQILMRQ